jgi:hypothetical protein
MRKLIALCVVGAVLVVALALVGASGAGAQVVNIVPVPYDPQNCTLARYDLNGDGTLNKKDVLYFDEHAARCMDPFGMALPGVECDENLDVDRDGKVDRYDLDYLYRYILSCLYPPRANSGAPVPPPTEP